MKGFLLTLKRYRNKLAEKLPAYPDATVGTPTSRGVGATARNHAIMSRGTASCLVAPFLLVPVLRFLRDDENGNDGNVRRNNV